MTMLTLGLYALYALAKWLYLQSWILVNPRLDIDVYLSIGIQDVFLTAMNYMIYLSILTTLLAAFFSAINNRLSMPIRLLATAESLNRFIYAVCYASRRFCSDNEIGLPNWFCSPVLATYDYSSTDIVSDTSQYCQLLISISRFFALSFDGRYYRNTLKWPVGQLLLPYLLRIGIEVIRPFLYSQGIDVLDEDSYLMMFPLFLMCSLDWVTNQKMRKLKRHNKTSHVERLLMIQMLSNSFLILWITIFYLFALDFVNLLFGYNVLFLWLEFSDFTRVLLFNLMASMINVFFLRKRKEKPQNGRRVTVSSVFSANTNKK